MDAYDGCLLGRMDVAPSIDQGPVVWTPDEQKLIDEIGVSLRAKGYATRTTVERLLETWRELVASLSKYEETIDDYTNSLSARDGLEDALRLCPLSTLRARLSGVIRALDEQYREATTDDGGAALSKYFRISEREGWWWRRCPREGPLAEYLGVNSAE